MLSCLLHFLALTGLCSGQLRDNLLDRVSLEQHPGAVCMDGTPAVYYRNIAADKQSAN